MENIEFELVTYFSRTRWWWYRQSNICETIIWKCFTVEGTLIWKKEKCRYWYYEHERIKIYLFELGFYEIKFLHQCFSFKTLHVILYCICFNTIQSRWLSKRAKVEWIVNRNFIMSLIHHLPHYALQPHYREIMK